MRGWGLVARKPPTPQNPWVASKQAPPEQVQAPLRTRPVNRSPVVPVRGLVGPTPSGGLPTWEPDPSRAIPRWWWVPCHGGAGSTTLAAAIGGADAGRGGWPRYPEGVRPGVVLVARTHAAGLQSAQSAARQWASGAVGPVRLLGLVAVADAPGRLPGQLRQWLHLLAGGLPHVWAVPWHEPWRLGERPSPESAPRQVAKIARELRLAGESIERGIR
ncbi:DUF6668 family protein [Yinghuangia aomiensis]|uniref:DUF6668 family protein n=1 Tax=Yinghuangia aomiensis TaxID=676205 RepID=UPI003CD0A584